MTVRRQAFSELEDDGRMQPTPFHSRMVDVMEELMKSTLLVRDRADRYSERVESAEAVSRRVNQRSI